jgi:hypothetical protein
MLKEDGHANYEKEMSKIYSGRAEMNENAFSMYL